MERLTNKCWRDLHPWEYCGQDNYCARGSHDEGGCANGCVVPNIYCRLAAYEDAEEQGRLVILPCKLGDAVWVLHTGINTNFLHVYEGRCVEISQSLSCGAMLESYTINLLAFNVVFYGHDIGSTMFFSRSEAEAALKKRKEE